MRPPWNMRAKVHTFQSRNASLTYLTSAAHAGVNSLVTELLRTTVVVEQQAALDEFTLSVGEELGSVGVIV